MRSRGEGFVEGRVVKYTRLEYRIGCLEMYLSPSEELVLVPVRENKKERLCLFERLRREPTPFGPQTMGWDSQFTSNAKVVRFLSCRERYLFLCARVAALS